MIDNKPNSLIIGLSGVAGSGKDTLCQLLIKEFLKKGLSAKRFALADALKAEVKDWCIKSYGIDPENCSREDKALIRAFLVFHGNFRRKQSNGKHWTNLLEKEIAKSNNHIAIVTDIRYDEYVEDEVFWIKNKMGGILIHVSLVEEDGRVLQAPNEEERRNDPRLKSKADISVGWPKSKSEDFSDVNKYAEYIVSNYV